MPTPEVLIYTSPICGYCSAAKALLKKKGATWREIDIATDETLRNQMIERTGRRTVPQIFIGDHHVGGYDDLAALERRGELDTLLQSTT